MPAELTEGLNYGQREAMRFLVTKASSVIVTGPPGAGKSMLAARLPGLLPPLSPREALDVTMLHSVAGQLHADRLIQTRPFCDPHNSASMTALVGGGAWVHRILRVARTIADLERSDGIERRHLAEALAYRAMPLLA